MQLPASRSAGSEEHKSQGSVREVRMVAYVVNDVKQEHSLQFKNPSMVVWQTSMDSAEWGDAQVAVIRG